LDKINHIHFSTWKPIKHDRIFRNSCLCLQMINIHDCCVFIVVFVYYI
jgi:hypothetical protein